MNTIPASLAAVLLFSPLVLAEKSVLPIAGPKSHGAWQHEHPDGCELLAKHLNASGLGITAEASLGWPAYPAKAVNAIVWTAGADVPENGVTSTIATSPAYQTIDEAIAKDDINDVKLHLAQNPECLQKGGKPNSRPPLEQAVLRNKTAIAVLLLENGADPNTANTSKRTPLHLAIERNNPAIVSALLKAGAKPDAQDQAGWTPLHHAAAKNQLENAKALLAAGANPMTLSELGGTPLHEAAASGGAELIRLLLDHKVDPDLKSKQGVTALDLAKQYKNQPAIDALRGR